MHAVSTVALPGPVRSVAAGASTVWCAAGDRLLAYAAGGRLVAETAAPAGLVSLAAASDLLTAALEPGIVAWLDANAGDEVARRPVGGELEVAAGGGSVWALDRVSQRAWRLVDHGVLTEPITVARVDEFAPEGDRVWWTSRDDTLLRGGARPVDLEVSADERGAMTACVGSVWISVADALLRVGAWGAERGPSLPAPEGPVRHLTCADGVLVGGSGRRGLFVLDPAVDADVRHVDVDLGGELDFLVATRTVAWALPEGMAEARLVPLRPGD